LDYSSAQSDFRATQEIEYSEEASTMQKVLIIDSEPRRAILVAAVVETELKCIPVVACSKESALEAMDSFEYALIICSARLKPEQHQKLLALLNQSHRSTDRGKIY